MLAPLSSSNWTKTSRLFTFLLRLSVLFPLVYQAVPLTLSNCHKRLSLQFQVTLFMDHEIKFQKVLDAYLSISSATC